MALGVGLMLGMLAGCTQDDGLTRTERARKNVHPKAAEYLLLAQDAMESGNFASALVLADSAGTYAPELADVPFLKARLYGDMQRLGDALTEYQKTLEMDPEYRGAWRNMGNLALRGGDYQRAYGLYRHELDVYEDPEVWVLIGRTYEQRQMADSARMAFERAIEMNPELAEGYLRLGQIYKELGNLEKAVAVSREGLALDPQNLNYQYAVGSLLILTGELEEAEGYLRAVVNAQPWHYWANYNLGRTLVRLGQEAEAQEYLSHAERLQQHLAEIDYWEGLARNNPEHLMLWVKLADALRRAGRVEEAERATSMALSLAPRYMMREFEGPLAEENVEAGMAMVRGDIDAALAHYQQLVKAHPDVADLWVNLGIVYAARGQVDEAQSAWETAMQHVPQHRFAKGYLHQILQTYIPAQ